MEKGGESAELRSSGAIESLDDLDLVSPRGEVRYGLSAKEVIDPGLINSPPLLAEQSRATNMIFDDMAITEGYDAVPILEVDHLPRGGISIDTKAVGRIQFGIPPESIKDSMQLGIEVPRVYIIPAERFCRDMGPALGINLAEFEFPAYFNFFVRQKKCLLLVDSVEAETDIRKVFEETLLGPSEFRDEEMKLASVDEDFDPSFPNNSRPNFYQELKHFRILDKKNKESELTIDMLVEFYHFAEQDILDSKEREESIGIPRRTDAPTPIPLLHGSVSTLNPSDQPSKTLPGLNSWIRGNGVARAVDDLGTLPSLAKTKSVGSIYSSFSVDGDSIIPSVSGDTERRQSDVKKPNHARASRWLYSKVKLLGEKATIWPMDATIEQIENRTVPRVEIFRMQGGAEYVLHEVGVDNIITGKVRFSGNVRVPEKIAVEGFLSFEDERAPCVEPPLRNARTFHPPPFGVTVLGNSHGFDKNGSTSGYVLWINGRGVMVDPPPYSSSTLSREGILPQMIIGVIITHCHADHDAGTFQKILTGSRVAVITSPSIYKSFIRKYAALSGLKPSLLRHCHRYRPAIIGQRLDFQGATFHFTYSLHTIPCLAFRAEWQGRSIVFTGDHLNLPPLISELEAKGVLSRGRANDLRRLPLQDCDILLHEAGAPPVHTPLVVLQQLPEHIKERMYVVHTSALPDDSGLRVAPVGTDNTIRLSSVVKADIRGKHQPSPMVEGVEHFFTHVSATLPDVVNNVNDVKKDSLTTAPPMRPPDIMDAWFVLNLLSNIPFFSSLSYPNAMEVLEISKIQVHKSGDIVVYANQRSEVLCVVWEGTLMEVTVIRNKASSATDDFTVFKSGDWLGPVVLQPETGSHPASTMSEYDVSVVSREGAKVILLQMSDLEKILLRGSEVYRKYLSHRQEEACQNVYPRKLKTGETHSEFDFQKLNLPATEYILHTINTNSVLAHLSPLIKRSLESIAEGPKEIEKGSPLWKVGTPCERAFLVVSGTATHAGFPNTTISEESQSRRRSAVGSIVEIESGRLVEVDRPLCGVSLDSEYGKLDHYLTSRAKNARSHDDSDKSKRRTRSQVALDRFLNKVLARLNSRRRYMANLVYSRGCFLCDATRMVCGDLVFDAAETDNMVESNVHSSTILAGEHGCAVYEFPRMALIQLFDANPGLLLSLLGTQVVV